MDLTPKDLDHMAWGYFLLWSQLLPVMWKW